MKRLLVVLLGALALAATGCDAAPSAATVRLGGQTAVISQSQLLSDLDAIAQGTTSSSGVAQLSPTACLLELQSSNMLPATQGAGDGTVTQELAKFQLDNLIFDALVHQVLTRNDRQVTAADIAAARADLVAQLSQSQSPCGYQGEQLVARVPGDFFSREVTALAEQEQLIAALGRVDLSPAGIAAYYQSHQAEFQLLCLSAVVVDTQAQAAQLRQQVTSGALSFQAAASQFSTDQQSKQNGGQLGCTPLGQVQNQVVLGAINGLNVGDVSQPVTESNQLTGAPIWILFKLDGKPLIPLSQARTQIRQDLLAAHTGPYDAELGRIAAVAHVAVNPQYGTWSSLSGVRSPVPPPARDVLCPGANMAASSRVSGGCSILGAGLGANGSGGSGGTAGAGGAGGTAGG